MDSGLNSDATHVDRIAKESFAWFSRKTAYIPFGSHNLGLVVLGIF
jgi:hypothetical protein